jgi:hypothetical protein
MISNFANNGDFHAIEWILYIPQICDMGRHVEDFFALKSDGFGRVRTRELGYQRPARYL